MMYGLHAAWRVTCHAATIMLLGFAQAAGSQGCVSRMLAARSFGCSQIECGKASMQ